MIKVWLITTFFLGATSGILFTLWTGKILPKGEWECYEAKAKMYIHVSVK